MVKRNLQQTSHSRVFLIEDGAGPANAPTYQALARAQAVSWPQGDSTPIRIPDPNQYGKFITVERIKGQRGLPGLTVQFRMTREISDVLKIVRKECPVDLQLHVGACKDPSDFNQGWEKIHILEGAEATDYGTDDLGALDADQNAVVHENIPFTGLDYYEVKQLAGAEVAESELVQEAVDIVICDTRTCGECGLPSDGCQRVFIVTKSAGGSPGLAAEIIFTVDGGATIQQTNVSTLAANEDPSAMTCVGSNLVVVSEDSESLHFALVVDIIDEAETWAEVSTGFVANKGPLDIFSISRTFTWIAAEGGYIYFSEDIEAGVEVQTAGTDTTEDLNAIHGSDELNLVAVGNNNAVLATLNGGETWSGITGPAVGVNLTAVYVRSATEWFIGTANGKLYYTRNGGTTWTEKLFSGSGTGTVEDIAFATGAVGYLSHTTAAGRGRILRTISGGHSWYVLPEATGLSLPLADKFNSLAACGEDPNLVWAAGLADNAADGIVVKVA